MKSEKYGKYLRIKPENQDVQLGGTAIDENSIFEIEGPDRDGAIFLKPDNFEKVIFVNKNSGFVSLWEKGSWWARLFIRFIGDSTTRIRIVSAIRQADLFAKDKGGWIDVEATNDYEEGQEVWTVECTEERKDKLYLISIF